MEHLSGCAPGKGQEQDPSGFDAARDEEGDPVRECGRLSGSCPGDNEQGPFPVRGGDSLLIVEVCKQRISEGAGICTEGGLGHWRTPVRLGRRERITERALNANTCSFC
jgi:hypothetical protein